MVEQLLEHGADANSLNRQERSALDLAIKAKRAEIVAILDQRTSVKRVACELT